MFLTRIRLVEYGPFESAQLDFLEDGDPRLVTVIQGGGGLGKTTLLSALAATRPGHTVVSAAWHPEREESGMVVAEYRLGQDDPDRVHPLVVATPNARVFSDEAKEGARRRDQMLFDRVARDGGFVFVALPANRWFSRQPLALLGPGKSIARYDVRSAVGFDDPTRADLARETKQALAYAEIAGALGSEQPNRRRFLALREAMVFAVNQLVTLSGYHYLGLDALTLEPKFSGPGLPQLFFDSLPTRSRHLVAFAALSVRSLWAAHPERDPREAEGIVAIDEADLYLDAGIQGGLVAALKQALPRVQWILTTTSPNVADSCDVREVLALRRSPDLRHVEIFSGLSARTH